MTPSEKRFDESNAMVIASRTQGRVGRLRYAAAAPPGLGPDVERTATARGTTLRTRPQLGHVSMSAERPRSHIGQMTASPSLQRSQRFVPDGYTSWSRRQYGRPTG